MDSGIMLQAYLMISWKLLFTGSSSLAAHDNRIQLHNLVLYECRRRRNEGSGEKENETRRDERRVKKQRTSDGQGAAERRW